MIKAAQDYAKMVAEAQKLKIHVELLRPVHLNFQTARWNTMQATRKPTKQQNCGGNLDMYR
jgi:hypothetical protein